MTSVNVTTTKNTVTVSEGDTRIVTIKTQGPQGPAFSDGDKGDVTVSSNGTAISINSNAITSAKIADGAIVDADINASAAIALSKLATGALPTAITVTSANISDLSIVDADISGSAAISLSKLATGALPTAITVTSANISDLSIVNADINASAAIAGTKISPDFGSQNIVTTGTAATGALGVTGNITVSGTVDGRDVATDGTKLDGIETGATADQTKADIDALGIAASTAATLLNARTIAGASFDGSANIDISYTNLTNKLSVGDGGLTQNNFTDALKTKLDGIETAATADQTAAEIKTLLDSNGIVNSNVDASAAIAGTKISPDFGSQNIVTTGTFASNDVTITSSIPTISLIDAGNNPDYQIRNTNGSFDIKDITTNVTRVTISSSSTYIGTNVDCAAGVDVTGNITVTGTVDGVDIATRDTLFGGLTSSSGVLTNGVTATTQSASDNSTKVATTAYTDTAISNLVNSAPSTLDTLKELSDALGSDPNFATTVTNSIATKLPLAGGTLTGNLTISHDHPRIIFNDTSNNPDYLIDVNAGHFLIYDSTNSANRLLINSDGHIDLLGNVDITNGLDVTGNITVSGTVDGRDIATDGTKLDGIESNATADQTASEIVALVADQTIAPSEIDMEDNEKIKIGTGDDLQIYHDGDNSYIIDIGTGSLILGGDRIRLRSSTGEDGIEMFQNGAVELYYDNSKKLETSSDGILASGAIRTNAATSGAASANQATFDFNGQNARLLSYHGSGSSISAFTNPNGGSLAERFRIDADGHVLIPADNARLQIGASQDLEIYHDGTNSVIDNNTGRLELSSTGNVIIKPGDKKGIICREDAEVELYYDDFQKLETTSTGISVTGIGVIDNTSSTTDPGLTISNSSTSALSTSENLEGTTNKKLTPLFLKNTANAANAETYLGFHAGSSFISQWNIGVRKTASMSGDFIFNTRTGSATSAQRLKITHGGDLVIPNDNAKLQIGASQDLEIYHDGSHSIINDSVGSLLVRSNIVQISTPAGSKYFKGQSGVTELYYDDSKKFETTSTGATITGTLIADGLTLGSDELINLGNNNNLRLFFEQSTGNNVIQNHYNTLEIRDTSGGGTGVVGAKFVNAAQVELNHNGSKKLETTSGGISVTGNIAVSGTVDGVDVAALSASVSGFLSNIVEDTSPQLGGTLDTNNQNIEFGDVGNTSQNRLKFGASGDMSIFHDASSSKNFISTIGNNDCSITSRRVDIKSDDNSETIASFIKNGAVKLYYDNSKKFETVSSGISVTGEVRPTSHLVMNAADNQIIYLGAGNDLQIYHDGSTNNSHIKEAGSGCLVLNTDCFRLKNAAHTENLIAADINSSVRLFYDNSKKLETFSGGISVTGQVNSDGSHMGDSDKALFGDSNDLQIYHNGSDTYIDNDTGRLLINTASDEVQINKGTSEYMARFIVDGAVELYYDNSRKAFTYADGLHIDTGTLRGDDNALIKLGTDGDLEIYHSSSNNDSFIKELGTGRLQIWTSSLHLKNQAGDEINLVTNENGNCELWFDNSKKFETTSTGVSLNDGDIAHVGSISLDLIKGDADDNTNITFAGSDVITFKCGTTSPALTVNTTQVKVEDNQKFVVGTGNDLQIYHDGSNSYIKDDGTGAVILQTNKLQIQNTAAGEDLAKFTQNGAVELYYDNTKKFETTSTGISVTGHVGINTASTDQALHVIGTGDDTIPVRVESTGITSRIGFQASGTANSYNVACGASAEDFTIHTGNTERMRVDDTGRVMIGTTSNSMDGVNGDLNIANDNINNNTVINCSRNTTNDRSQIRFSNPNGNVGSITTSASATSFNTSSDYRLKENEVAISDGITRLKQLKAYKFNFKTDSSTILDGFFAHEVSSVVPQAITGTKDAVVTQAMIDAGDFVKGTLNNPIYQSIDHSKLVPLLVAAVQELIVKVEALEAA